jgi:hypothetical protein
MRGERDEAVAGPATARITIAAVATRSESRTIERRIAIRAVARRRRKASAFSQSERRLHRHERLGVGLGVVAQPER